MFTEQEIAEIGGIFGTPVDKAQEILDKLNAGGFVFRNKRLEDEFSANFETNVFTPRLNKAIEEGIETGIKSKIRERNEQAEKTIFELTGHPKSSPTQKWYDYMIEAYNKLKSSPASADKDEKLKAMEGTLDQYKATVDQLNAEKTALETDYKKQLGSLKRESFINSDLSKVRIAYPAHITSDADKKSYSDMVISTIKKGMEEYEIGEVNGATVLMKNGVPETNTTTHAHKTAFDVIKDRFGLYLAPETAPGGAGTDPKSIPPPAGSKVSTGKFSKIAREKGWATNSPEWRAGYAEMVDPTIKDAA